MIQVSEEAIATIQNLITAAELANNSLHSPALGRAIAEALFIPDPHCIYCLGTGDYYTHSPDCDDDLCALAGGCHECRGVVIKCGCSIARPEAE
jgi:hypothetical protein